MTFSGEVQYRLDLSDHDDNIVASFTGLGLDNTGGGLQSASCRIRLKTAGAFSTRIYGLDSRIEEFLQLDTGVDYKWRMYRTDPLWDNKERKIGMFFHRGEQDEQRSDGSFVYTSYGTGLNVFFSSEPIVFPAGSSQATKSGEAAQVAYEYVNENIGGLAGVDAEGNSRVRPNLTLVSTVSSPTGKIWTGDRSNKLLADVIAELADFDVADYRIQEDENLNFVYDII